MTRPPTMQDVADRAGVSRALVSLVMRNASNVSDERRAAVLRAADQLGYRPNVLARNLASNRTRTIGVMINDLHNPYFADVLDGMEKPAAAHGYRLLINTGWRKPSSERAAVETMLEFRTDGIVLAGPRLATRHILEAAREVPITLVGRVVRSDSVDTVNNDEHAGAALVVEHLRDLGHDRITHFDGGSGAGAAARRAGYIAAMKAAGLGDRVSIISGDFTEISGARAAEELLDGGTLPTAIFAANDLMAAGALNRFEASGVIAPRDLSIVGYDNTALAAMQHMSLSTVNQPREEMGRRAIECLIERLEQQRTSPRADTLQPTLIARRTSGPAPSVASS